MIQILTKTKTNVLMFPSGKEKKNLIDRVKYLSIQRVDWAYLLSWEDDSVFTQNSSELMDEIFLKAAPIANREKKKTEKVIIRKPTSWM